MVIITRDMIKQFQILMEASDDRLKFAFENLHQGYPTETMTRFLNARDGNISKAHRMLVDALNWRINNNIDEILSKPIICISVMDSQLTGLSGYTKNGEPVIDIGVGLSTYDKASISYNIFKENVRDQMRTSKVPNGESIDRIFRKFDSDEESRLLQFWACMLSNSEDIGCNLMLTNQTFMSTRDEGLEEYRKRCLEKRYRFVGLGTSVGNWLAGRAAQTGIADHRTEHHVLNREDQHFADVGGKGQLVLPVFYDQGAGNKLVGIIELVTSVPKGSYVEDFEQFHSLLKDEGLKSSYMGKTIKVEYVGLMIKFTLPLSAECKDLHREVKKRFPEFEPKNYHVEYDDTEGNRLPISSDEDLRVCMDESSFKGGQFIRMCVLLKA